MATRFDHLKKCLHLRCKQMFYEDLDPNEARELEVPSSSSDTTAYWCDCTQTGRGPDDRPVNLRECGARRACFETTVDVADLT